MLRMGLVGADLDPKGNAFATGAKQVMAYFRQWTDGCYDKWIPEECFNFPIAARERMLEALLLGDGRWNKKRVAYLLAVAIECERSP